MDMFTLLYNIVTKKHFDASFKVRPQIYLVDSWIYCEESLYSQIFGEKSLQDMYS